ncbi:MAG: hypothetical protein NZM25_10165 [Leptospiraceae bacterium]|nr:hypothetical protein [Leptospiraceae bacterium]MDW8307514.1 hypothetical protein [Leptospiraceae bacterium]
MNIPKATDLTEALAITTSNLMGSAYLGFRFPIATVGLVPRLGGGYVVQQIRVTGLRNENLTNSMPFTALGLDMCYPLNQNLELVLSFENFAQLQAGKVTLGNFALGGFALRF